MEFFKIGRDIPFMRYALIFNVISIATFVLAVFFLITRGLHLSVEFTGGTGSILRNAAGREEARPVLKSIYRRGKGRHEAGPGRTWPGRLTWKRPGRNTCPRSPDRCRRP